MDENKKISKSSYFQQLSAHGSQGQKLKDKKRDSQSKLVTNNNPNTGSHNNTNINLNKNSNHNNNNNNNSNNNNNNSDNNNMASYTMNHHKKRGAPLGVSSVRGAPLGGGAPLKKNVKKVEEVLGNMRFEHFFFFIVFLFLFLCVWLWVFGGFICFEKM